MNFPHSSMPQPHASVQMLTPENLTIEPSADFFTFADTSAFLQAAQAQDDPMLVLQAEAKKNAQFGLSIPQKGFHVLALGAVGTGRTTLMLHAMHEAAQDVGGKKLADWVALYQFSEESRPLLLKLPAGSANVLKQALDHLIRTLSQALAGYLEQKVSKEHLAQLKKIVSEEMVQLKSRCAFAEHHLALQQYFAALAQDAQRYLDAWQATPQAEGDQHLENMLSEAFLSRYRANVLVTHAETEMRPVIADQDPSLISLFGGLESAGENSNTPDFLRLRAGNLLRADGGMLLMHLRDILADEQNGLQILEKLHRFLRNGTLQIEDLSSSNQSTSFIAAQVILPVDVKVVLIATREDYYSLLGEVPDFFKFFPTKIDFAERISASAPHYLAYAKWIAQKCQTLELKHFTKSAVICLLQWMHRLEEDQAYLSAELGALEKLLIESHAVAAIAQAALVDKLHVKAALSNRHARNAFVERQSRESIFHQELLINVQGHKIGQINALTHVDLAEASFGAPVRVTANCYPGMRGVLTIDREVQLSGPTHDKGVFILQSWLQQYFADLNPLHLSAAIVFEQEYSGVDGDSASCAELFALLSAISALPIRQGFAVTGAMNQHGEVQPVGGLNEKIEGYFRVCQQAGLDGSQGVLIPAGNARHLMLNHEVVEAVRKGQFKMMSMTHVLEGLLWMLDTTQDAFDAAARARLIGMREILEKNQPVQSVKQIQ